MKKTNDNSIEEASVTKNHRCWKAVFDRLKTWSMKKNAMIMEEFLVNEGISYDSYKSAKNNDPELQEIHKQVMLTCGVNREKLALRNNPSTAKESLSQFIPRWKEHEEWKSDLKRNEQPAPSNINVHFKDIKKKKPDDK